MYLRNTYMWNNLILIQVIRKKSMKQESFYSITELILIGGLPCSPRAVQPVARRLHMTQDGCECSPTQNRTFTQNLYFALQFSLGFVYLLCGPRQLFFQCDPETPKVWTPL